jgi:hypothetical protein
MLSSTTKQNLSSCMETKERKRNQLMNKSVDDGCDSILYPSILLLNSFCSPYECILLSFSLITKDLIIWQVILSQIWGGMKSIVNPLYILQSRIGQCIAWLQEYIVKRRWKCISMPPWLSYELSATPKHQLPFTCETHRRVYLAELLEQLLH